MRVFIALPISDHLQQTILSWRKTYSYLPVRWLQGKNLHITLVPPWEEHSPKDLELKLNSLAGKTGAFELNFTNVSFGPVIKDPRLIWATGPTPQSLLYLKESLETTLKKTSKKKDFLTHLTMARFSPSDFPLFSTHELGKPVHWKDVATSFVLMESTLTPQGADYTVLQTVQL